MDVSSLDSLGSVVSGMAAAALIFILIFGAIFLGIVIFEVICLVKLFQKCNQPGWAAIVPGYNLWVEAKMVGCHWVVFAGLVCSFVANIISVPGLSGLLTLVALFAEVLVNINLAKKFGKDTGFIVGLCLLPLVFMPILALGKKNTFNANAEVKNCGFFSVNF